MISPATLLPAATNLFSRPTGPTPVEFTVAATTQDSSAVRTDGRSLRMDAQPEHVTALPSQRGVAEAFPSTPENILMHLHNAFATEELDTEATTKHSLVVRTEGSGQISRPIRHYNLDALVSVGYRVDSQHTARVPHSAPAVPAALRNARVRFTPRSMR